MTAFDILIISVFLLSTAVGVWRGFIKEALSLGTWFGAGAIAWLLADLVAEVFNKDINQPTLRLVAAFVIIFIVVYVLGSVLTRMLDKMLTRKPLLKATNYVLGGFMGVLRAMLIIIIGFLLAGLLPAIPQSEWWRASVVAPHIEGMALFSSKFLPQDIARHIRYD